MCDAWSFSGLTSKIPPLGSMLNFDAKKRPRVTNVKTASLACLLHTKQSIFHPVRARGMTPTCRIGRQKRDSPLDEDDEEECEEAEHPDDEADHPEDEV